jgi:cytochrome P450
MFGAGHLNIRYIEFYSIRGMSLDESVYSNPKVFNPARYLPKPAGAGEPHFSDISFGFGRRFVGFCSLLTL